MLLTSVILVLREILEAALLVSILAALSRHLHRDLTWLPLAFAVGIPCALLYAANIRYISESFDYVGQEVANALLQSSVSIAIVVLSWLMATPGIYASDPKAGFLARRFSWFSLCAVLAVGIAVTLEGSEIAVYLSGTLEQPEVLPAALIGGCIGAIIGVSTSILVFYGLMSLRHPMATFVLPVMLALACGNTLSQAARQLVQADLLAAGPLLWDSSAWLSEGSVTGQLLYALVGYESTPSMIEVIAYLCGMALVLLAVFTRERSG